MHVSVIAVGKRQPDWVRDASARYIDRFPSSWSFRLVEVEPGRSGDSGSKAEGDRILGRVPSKNRLIALDERGSGLSSVEFAAKLERWMLDGRDVDFVIGGADGLSEAVVDRADFVLALGPMTLAHGLARIVLLEQLYRAHTLAIGHPYHRS